MSYNPQQPHDYNQYPPQQPNNYNQYPPNYNQYPQQPQGFYQQQPMQQHVQYQQSQPKNPGVAVILELLPGLFHVFGIGHFYNGNIGLGFAFLLGYWALLFVNIILCFVLIGVITLPLCWLAMMIISPILASNGANAANRVR